MKYTTVKIAKIIVQVAENTDIIGYTRGVVESILPTDEELAGWNKKQEKDWIVSNNSRMQTICDFMNKNNL